MQPTEYFALYLQNTHRLRMLPEIIVVKLECFMLSGELENFDSAPARIFLFYRSYFLLESENPYALLYSVFVGEPSTHATVQHKS
jgi:hypothetical protein